MTAAARRRPTVYVASTLPFTLAGRQFVQKTLRPVLRTNGLEPLLAEDWGALGAADAFADAARGVRGAADAAAAHLGALHLKLLSECDCVLALLDGADVDSGVAAAIGYAARRVPIVGWRSDSRRSGVPITRLVNVLVEQLIYASGGMLTTDLNAAIRHLQSATSVR